MGDDVRQLLEGVDVVQLEQGTTGDGIKHKIGYRSSTGRLQGYQAGAQEQTLEVTLDKSDPNYDLWLGEALLGTLLERYDTFGVFHHYPRPFLVGPTQFHSVTGVFQNGPHGDGSAKVRNVDLLMSLKFVRDAAFPGSTRAVLSCVRFHHGIRLSGVLDAEWFSFEGKIGTGEHPSAPRQYDPMPDLEGILRGAFADGVQYTVIMTPEGINQRVGDVITTGRPLMTLMWIAQRLLSDRYADPNALGAEARAEEGWRQDHMLASALIGHMAYSIPEDKQQRKKPVPIGWFNTETLAFVLERVVLAPPPRISGGISADGTGGGEEGNLYDFDDEFDVGADDDLDPDMSVEIPLLDSSDEGDMPLEV